MSVLNTNSSRETDQSVAMIMIHMFEGTVSLDFYPPF